ncbi:MAG: type I glutamate--ammonia ligase [Armatimonadota bacterium]|nr:type I glutamate--ammonia ligase [Armatimonadota bacterium]MDR7449646.1 type I glutamate--ammonia ligase [Armatimonadota bacterium]MDR7458454.1 type I glutamate--ammonia ligase [Armatimonadota bacterium]MDR7478744.1 type I glutamate--ammonia ligase [Armatimonadota bacterium]MDR7487928.1 type I glutamate--ammonia ligase [Armatimonadota bacterium]
MGVAVTRERQTKAPEATPEAVVAMAREQGVQIVDLRFTDLFGQWQHFSLPVRELTVDIFSEGVGFDGSSIRGFQHIHESDLNLVPDPATARIDPLAATRTLLLICDVYDPVTRGPYSRDPRYIARKAEAHLVRSGVATTAYWGPEAEFFVFDDVRFSESANSAFYAVDSDEGIWNSGRDDRPNLAHRPRHKEGYFPVPPVDSLQEWRSELVLKMEEMGVEVEVHHHEVASAGQCEIDMRFAPLVEMGDRLMLYKYLVKMFARLRGKTATFMPKPIFGDNGSGMHTHQSLWKDGTNLFYDPQGYANLSETALFYIGGLLRHTPALMAFCAPTTNSYRRLVPGFEAPVNMVYSKRNRSAAIRIPVYSASPRAVRVEYRPPDPTANPYLAFAAMLMAGLDGIRNRIHPGEPMDVDLYELDGEGPAIPQVPGSLDQALRALEEDHAFLLEGGVFTPDVIETWIATKRRRDVDYVRLRPHPAEFYLYYDA